MGQDFLSDVELYYTTDDSIKNGVITVSGDEAKHILNVMRHSPGDIIYVTSGEGVIYKTEMTEAAKREAVLKIVEEYKYQNSLQNINFCLPRLKNRERFEFALEKCVELGITNFVVFEAARSVGKGAKTERWEKLLISAMKQSLRSYLPSVKFIKNLNREIPENAEVVVLDQNADKNFAEFTSEVYGPDKEYWFVFGPEGGMGEEEINELNPSYKLKLAPNRLRSETAIISAAAVIASLEEGK